MIRLHVEPGLAAAAGLSAIKALSWDHPGEEELVVVVGGRELKLGFAWRYSGSPGCRAALAEFGRVE